jgi:hypothetical protein
VGDGVAAMNTGDADAYATTLEPLPGIGDAWVPVRAIPWAYIPGAPWRRGGLLPIVGGCRSVRPSLAWREASGQLVDGEFGTATDP